MYLRLMLIQNASFHLLMQQEYVEAGKDLEGKGFDPRKLLVLDVKLLKKLYVRRLIFWFSWKSMIMIGDIYG